MQAARTLIRSKSLDQFLFDGSIIIGVDGIEIFRSNHRHCDKCLKAKHSETSTSFSRKNELREIIKKFIKGYMKMMLIPSETILSEKNLYTTQCLQAPY